MRKLFKKPLSKKQKIIIGLVSLAILIAAIVAVLVINSKQGDEFGVNTGVDASTLTGDAKELTVGEDGVEITSGGIYSLKTDIDSGCVIVRAGTADVKLILEGVSVTNPSGPAIYVESADNFYLELSGNNKLTATTTSDYNGAIYSKDDIAISGDGKLEITSNLDGIVGKDDLEIDGGTITIAAQDDGIVGKDSIKITGGDITVNATNNGLKTTNETEKGDAEIAGGKINITAGGDGIQIIANLLISAGELNITTAGGSGTTSISNQWLSGNTSSSAKGIKAEKSIQIDGGTVSIDSQDDCVHSNNNITVNNVTLTASSGDDGIHANSDLTINGGKLTINKSYEGIEAGTITINGGDIAVTASDDGFNAAGGSDTTSGRIGGQGAFSGDTSKTLTIASGNVYVNSGGDGLDSNGNVYIKGGTIHVDGPTNNGNGAVDYGDSGCEFVISGGTLVAVGSSGMAVNASSASQPSVLINLSNSYTAALSLGDIDYTPSKSYNSVLVSSSSLSTGKSYDLVISGNKIQSVTISNNITTSGASGMGGGMMPGGGQPGGRR